MAVDVDVEADGSGVVAVEVVFDADAAARLGDPGSALALDDLDAAGWAITGPVTSPDGSVVVGASRPFADPVEGQAVLDSVAGPGILGLDVAVDEAFLSTTTKVTGTVDLSAGLDAFADPDLDAAAGGLPFGGVVAAVESEEGKPVADLLGVEVTWSGAGSEASVTPKLGDPATTTTLESTVTNTTRITVLAVIGGVVLVGGVAALVVVLVRRRRRRRPDTSAVPDRAAPSVPDDVPATVPDETPSVVPDDGPSGEPDDTPAGVAEAGDATTEGDTEPDTS